MNREREAIAELAEAVRHYHAWLERVELHRDCSACGERGYMGLDHAIGENIEGCTGCHVLALVADLEPVGEG